MPILDERVYRTQHSDDWHRKIAEENLILLTTVGSELHGVSIKESDDHDEMGICIEPPSVILGTNPKAFEQYEFRTQPVNVRSGPGDIDRVVYSLRKYVKLAAAGNPTILMPLFTPDCDVLSIAWPGEDLRNARGMLLSKQAGERFLGYLESQRRHLGGERKPKVNRPELIAAHGYDTKYAYHALRIATQGIELMQTGHITLPMTEGNVDFLKSVRRGEFSLEFVLDRIHFLAGRLNEAMSASPLPDYPNYDGINNWLQMTYRRWWE